MEEINGTLEATKEPDSVSIELRRGVKGEYGWTVKVRIVADATPEGAANVAAVYARQVVERLDLDLRARYGQSAND